ncbi:MAG TPA: zf-HC2 domain-containing protein [Terriglobia bacterium]|nr:zf-HC2 domain-containing protein [Terriglobia bacterium]
MTCWRFRLRRKLLPYLEGALEAREVSRVERHLLDCATCRSLLVRLRSGHHLAQHLAALAPEEGPAAGFAAVMQAVERGAPAHGLRGPVWQGWLDRLSSPRAVPALAGLVVLQLGLLVASNHGLLFGNRASASLQANALDLADFRPLSLDQLRSNTQPHVMTEGYVEDVHTDEEEGTVAFKLVEHPDRTGSFVVCEIMSPIRLAPPRDGSHVRVYGVSRYDAQTDRKWYELNPVLNIASLKP